jgi:hypothetical protein
LKAKGSRPKKQPSLHFVVHNNLAKVEQFQRDPRFEAYARKSGETPIRVYSREVKGKDFLSSKSPSWGRVTFIMEKSRSSHVTSSVVLSSLPVRT